MITRVRKQNGQTVDVGKSDAVEVLDPRGLLSVVVITDRKGTVHILTPEDKLFAAYCRSNGMRSSKVHVHEPLPLAPAPM